jgi:hypothetical protein
MDKDDTRDVLPMRSIWWISGLLGPSLGSPGLTFMGGKARVRSYLACLKRIMPKMAVVDRDVMQGHGGASCPPGAAKSQLPNGCLHMHPTFASANSRSHTLFVLARRAGDLMNLQLSPTGR